MRRCDYTGQVLSERYLVVELLGEGGMGAVYAGKHIAIGKKLAIKFLHTEYADNEMVVKRFYQEAQTAAAIGHQNIIDVYDVGISSEGDPYLVMEYLEGESLAEMLERTGPIALPAACAILEPTLSALEAAHSAGIVHRDIKPENIFLVHGQEEAPHIKLVDFGISKFVTPGHSRITGTGVLLGTPAYMSPEQIRGSSEVTHLSDIYSVGVVMYEMLTGGKPFGGEHQNALLISILADPPTPPKQVFADFPEAATAVLMSLLQKMPEKRPQSAHAVIRKIEKLEDYGKRQATLLRYTLGARRTSFSGGDLGSKPPTPEGRSVAREVLSSQIYKETPANWTKTMAHLSSRRRLKSILAILVASVFLLLIGLFVLLNRTSTRPSPSRLPIQTLESTLLRSNNTVRITVEGAPDDAQIRFGDQVVSDRTFSVPFSDLPKTLKVTAFGCRELLLPVVPNRNQTVSVVLTPYPVTIPVEQRDAVTDDSDEPENKTLVLPAKSTPSALRRPNKPRLEKTKDADNADLENDADGRSSIVQCAGTKLFENFED